MGRAAEGKGVRRKGEKRTLCHYFFPFVLLLMLCSN